MRQHRAARTAPEAVLCSLFAEVLGVERVGIDDNFFELGGDSIVSIQLVSRARKAGLVLTARAVFQHQTVAALAASAESAAKSVRPAAAVSSSAAAADIAVGALAATPIMRWFAERGGPVGRFSQSMLLRSPAGLRGEHLSAALQALLDHHDALRLRLDAGGRTLKPAGQAFAVMPLGAVDASACLRRVDAGGLDERALRSLIREEAEAAERRLDPAAGRLLQAVWFDAGAERAGRLLLVIHHFAVDGVSWRILVPDLAAACQASAQGRAVVLPARSTSFRHWAERLVARAQDAAVVSELSFWRGMLGGPSLRLARRLAAARSVAGRERHGRAPDADASGRGDRGAADAGAFGVPRRHPRGAADRPGAGGGGLAGGRAQGQRSGRAGAGTVPERSAPSGALCGAARTSRATAARRCLRMST